MTLTSYEVMAMAEISDRDEAMKMNEIDKEVMVMVAQ
jgi:hypothetical protein